MLGQRNRRAPRFYMTVDASPTRSRWRLPALLTMLAALAFACLVVYVVSGGRPLWRQSLWRYAVACRRPLADVCTTCPSLADLDPDGDGRLNGAIAPNWSIEASLRPCTLGGWARARVHSRSSRTASVWDPSSPDLRPPYRRE
jgi:hypothetical protein